MTHAAPVTEVGVEAATRRLDATVTLSWILDTTTAGAVNEEILTIPLTGTKGGTIMTQIKTCTLTQSTQTTAIKNLIMTHRDQGGVDLTRGRLEHDYGARGGGGAEEEVDMGVKGMIIKTMSHSGVSRADGLAPHATTATLAFEMGRGTSSTQRT